MTTSIFSGIEKVLIANLDKSRTIVKIAVAWFTNPNLYNCLSRLISTDVTVEIVLADDYVNFSNRFNDFQQFINRGVAINIGKFPNLMHHKFCIIDERLLITGSYNWTMAAEQRNYENVIISNELSLVKSYSKEFGNIKDRTEKLSLILIILIGISLIRNLIRRYS